MQIRPYRPQDLEPLLLLWREARHAAFAYVPVQLIYSVEQDRGYFVHTILRQCHIWVAEDADEVVGFFALDGDLIDQLFVRVDRQGHGIGTSLLEKARSLSPGGLRLYTFQKNVGARRFYERHGFRAVRFGISPPPESEPDVEYVWPGQAVNL